MELLLGKGVSENPLDNIDGPALRAQSLFILALRNDPETQAHAFPDELAAIDGLIHLLDAVRDYCHDVKGVDCLLYEKGEEDQPGPACPKCGNPNGCGVGLPE